MARRLVEKGVRFVCVVSGGGPGNLQWDAHDDIEENHPRMAAQTDKPVAGIADGPETARAAGFDAGAVGRRVRPLARSRGRQGPRPPQPRLLHVDGRRRHQGRPGGRRHRRHRPSAVEPHHFRDIHTTILHQLGLDQDALSYPAPGPQGTADRGSRQSDREAGLAIRGRTAPFKRTQWSFAGVPLPYSRGSASRIETRPLSRDCKGAVRLRTTELLTSGIE